MSIEEGQGFILDEAIFDNLSLLESILSGKKNFGPVKIPVGTWHGTKIIFRLWSNFLKIFFYFFFVFFAYVVVKNFFCFDFDEISFIWWRQRVGQKSQFNA